MAEEATTTTIRHRLTPLAPHHNPSQLRQGQLQLQTVNRNQRAVAPASGPAQRPEELLATVLDTTWAVVAARGTANASAKGKGKGVARGRGSVSASVNDSINHPFSVLRVRAARQGMGICSAAVAPRLRVVVDMRVLVLGGLGDGKCIRDMA